MVLLCLFFLIACSAQDSSPSSDTNTHLGALKHLAVYHLGYPGALLLQQKEAQPVQSVESSSGAMIQEIYAISSPIPANATPQQIVSWYHQQLLKQGWKQDLNDYLAQYQEQEYWIQNTDFVHVGVFFQNTVKYYVPSVDTGRYGLVFEIDIGEQGYLGG